MKFNMILNYETEKQIIERYDWELYLKVLQHRYPKNKLYAVSQDWYDDSRFICKARGTYGDIIIGWEGVHSNS